MPTDSLGKLSSINIRPGVSVLTVLRHLNYKPWFALAEFVDNSLGSFLRHRDEIADGKGAKATLRVSITINATDNRITIRDNAAGIHARDFPRAFRAAEIPPDRSGLSEFGMGMKSAACWFAPRWSARTCALGENVERTVSFDIARIVADSMEELRIQEVPASPEDHFTEIVLSDVFKLPAGRTLGKIKEHLTDIYRIFIRQGTLELRINDEAMSYSAPEILEAPFFKTPHAEAVQWLKEIDINLSGDRQVYGFAAIRKTGSTSRAGFALFRRNRLIIGSADEGYRPEQLFGQSNSFIYQRLFGELHLRGFGVSHTKDGVQWDGLEEELLERIRDSLDEDPLPLLRQAREYRLTPRREELKRAADTALQRTAGVIEQEVAAVISGFETHPVFQTSSGETPAEFIASNPPIASKQIEIEHGSSRWRISLETSNDPEIGDWLEVISPSSGSDGVQELGIRLSLAHPFTQRFSSADPREIELMLRIAAAFALAEVLARGSGAKHAGWIRTIMNDLLRNAFSK